MHPSTVRSSLVLAVLVLIAPSRSAAQALTEDAPILGGTAATARALGIDVVPDRPRFLAELVRVLRPGGRLIVAVPAQDSFLGVATNNQLNLPPHHLTAWSDAALRSIGRLMSVELLQIVHEPVSGVHRRGFLDTWFAFVLNRLAGREPRPVDVGLAQRMVARTARAIGDRIGDLIPDYLLGRGHTVSAVFRRD